MNDEQVIDNVRRAPTQQEMVEQVLNGHVRIAMAMIVRGIVSTHQRVPPEYLLGIIAANTGKLLSEHLSADLATTLRFRNHFKEQFELGMKSVPMKAPPPPSNGPLG